MKRKTEKTTVYNPAAPFPRESLNPAWRHCRWVENHYFVTRL